MDEIDANLARIRKALFPRTGYHGLTYLIVGLVLVTAILIGGLLTRPEQQETPSISARFSHCGMIRRTCVVDGDTFWLEGLKVRIADIDTPEVSQPQCPAEKALGDRATNRLIELLNAGPFELRPGGSRDTDQYGRKLRVLVRENRSIGKQLVEEGLARTWTGRREPWC